MDVDVVMGAKLRAEKLHQEGSYESVIAQNNLFLEILLPSLLECWD
jgi:hypothetical protein